jgi:hypothetical protein
VDSIYFEIDLFPYINWEIYFLFQTMTAPIMVEAITMVIAVIIRISKVKTGTKVKVRIGTKVKVHQLSKVKRKGKALLETGIKAKVVWQEIGMEDKEGIGPKAHGTKGDHLVETGTRMLPGEIGPRGHLVVEIGTRDRGIGILVAQEIGKAVGTKVLPRPPRVPQTRLGRRVPLQMLGHQLFRMTRISQREMDSGIRVLLVGRDHGQTGLPEISSKEIGLMARGEDGIKGTGVGLPGVTGVQILALQEIGIHKGQIISGQVLEPREVEARVVMYRISLTTLELKVKAIGVKVRVETGPKDLVEIGLKDPGIVVPQMALRPRVENRKRTGINLMVNMSSYFLYLFYCSFVISF